MKIIKLSEHGYNEARLGFSLSYNTSILRADEILSKYAFGKPGENKFLEMIMLWWDVSAPRYWWQEADCYRVGSVKQSECYSFDTEVLTSKGWKLFKDVTEKDLFYTLNPKNKKIELQKATKHFSTFYSGKMISIKNRSVDLLVTPNHNLLHKSHRKEELNFITASELLTTRKQLQIPKESVWEGSDINENFVIENIRVNTKKWIAFLGIWISEGYTCNNRVEVGVCQSEKSVYFNEINELLSSLPFDFKLNIYKGEGKWITKNKILYDYLTKFGKANYKYIPQELLDLKIDYLQILEKWLMYGDGSIRNNKHVYTTTSKILADNMQELFLKLGFGARIRFENKKYPVYRVYRWKTKLHWVFSSNVNEIDYKNMIYCVEVPNHTLYVRRDGKPVWSGNSTMHTLNKKPVSQENFEHEIPSWFLDFINSLIREKAELVTIKNILPEGFIQRRIWMFSYKTLQNIYNQRKDHKLIEWRICLDSMIQQIDHPEFIIEGFKRSNE